MADTNQTNQNNDTPPSDSFGIGGKDIAAGLRGLNPLPAEQPEAAAPVANDQNTKVDK